jgi:archaeosine-15-forming tRNA-guanine transglycosylase
MKDSGDFELQLTPAELGALLQALAVDGVMDFDAAAARAERRQLVAHEYAGTGILRQISDDTDTLITVRLDMYRGNSAAPVIRNLHRQLRWSNLELDARRFPASDRLTRANNGARRLHALIEHPALRRIPGN